MPRATSQATTSSAQARDAQARADLPDGAAVEHVAEPIEDRPIFTLELAEPEVDWEVEEERLQRFATSPELLAAGRGANGWADLLVEYGRDYFAASSHTMNAAEFEELVYDIFPRKVSCESSSAPEIVAELRAFWAFMKREYSAEHADACSAVLGHDAEVVLERELSDPSNFGMAKSFFMAGSEMGFDMTSQEGMDRWMHTVNAKVARMAMPHASRPAFLPAARVLTSQERRLRRNKRKAQRAARKKHR